MTSRTKSRFMRIALSIHLICVTSNALAWGSVGHDVITRVAVRLLQEKVHGNAKCAGPFTDKEVMLGHLANIPDTYWRSLDSNLTASGNPTHFIDWEILSKNPTFSTISASYDKLAPLARLACNPGNKKQSCPATGLAVNGKPLSQVIGSAPWRVGQFWELMRQEMIKLSKEKNPQNFVLAGNEMLKNAGLMSHFIGDLTMPLHSSVDYDAAAIGQSGLHAYFETTIVEALPLGLAEQVFEAASKGTPYKKIILPQIQHQGPPSAVEIALATSFASFRRISEMEELDRKHSLLPNKIKDAKEKHPARKPAAEAAKFFRPMIVEQLALAADTLAQLWLRAWEDGQSPDLSTFHSYFFWFTPDFVAPDYTKD